MSPPAGVVDGLLAGRYRLVHLLGSGANGQVWRARDERLDRDVAVKVLRPELTGDEDARARFRAEAQHAGRLRSPGIATVFDFAEDDDGAWLVLELVDGEPLSEVLRREGRLPPERTLDVVAQTAAALQAAHDGGVVHRDVKPGNLMLRRDGRLSVTDFGIAHAAGSAHLTRTGQVVGTASYLSPEQASGGPVTAAADLYALGVVAYECLAGRRPFERDDPVAVLLAHLQTPPPALPDDVPAPVADLVRRLLAKAPADRPVTAQQVQQEAEALRQGLPAAAGAAATATVAPATAVLPAATGPGAAAAGRGLTGRPGQRRAVRATAVALALLALALGVRDATRDDAADVSDVPATQPVTSVPAEQQAPLPAPEAPVVQVPAPAEQPAQEQPAEEQPVEERDEPATGAGAKDEVTDQERAEQRLEQQQEQAEREREKQLEQQEKDRGRQQDGKGRGGG